ncbi:hypothetical protein AVEN_61789-1 [Araneus ventricosus]|uniref:Uncharacterized protein n=1 Tax=Araneus ventricosus TaxID=182803 RepID=A0A4Y2U478_ARAVE|nr:hypothetical protein AVEN_61789-1 [Araneus ventricosus]
MCTFRSTEIAHTKNETLSHLCGVSTKMMAHAPRSTLQVRAVLQDCSGKQCASMCPHKRLSHVVISGEYEDQSMPVPKNVNSSKNACFLEV